MLVASMRNCARTRSLMRKSFIAEKSKLIAFGPRRMFTPELPNRPTFTGFVQTGMFTGQPGIVNARASKKLVMDWPEESLPLAIRSGLAIKLVLGPRLLVFEGSKPE